MDGNELVETFNTEIEKQNGEYLKVFDEELDSEINKELEEKRKIASRKKLNQKREAREKELLEAKKRKLTEEMIEENRDYVRESILAENYQRSEEERKRKRAERLKLSLGNNGRGVIKDVPITGNDFGSNRFTANVGTTADLQKLAKRVENTLKANQAVMNRLLTLLDKNIYPHKLQTVTQSVNNTQNETINLGVYNTNLNTENRQTFTLSQNSPSTREISEVSLDPRNRGLTVSQRFTLLNAIKLLKDEKGPREAESLEKYLSAVLTMMPTLKPEEAVQVAIDSKKIYNDQISQERNRVTREVRSRRNISEENLGVISDMQAKKEVQVRLERTAREMFGEQLERIQIPEQKYNEFFEQAHSMVSSTGDLTGILSDQKVTEILSRATEEPQGDLDSKIIDLSIELQRIESEYGKTETQKSPDEYLKQAETIISINDDEKIKSILEGEQSKDDKEFAIAEQMQEDYRMDTAVDKIKELMRSELGEIFEVENIDKLKESPLLRKAFSDSELQEISRRLVKNDSKANLEENDAYLKYSQGMVDKFAAEHPEISKDKLEEAKQFDRILKATEGVIRGRYTQEQNKVSEQEIKKMIDNIYSSAGVKEVAQSVNSNTEELKQSSQAVQESVHSNKEVLKPSSQAISESVHSNITEQNQSPTKTSKKRVKESQPTLNDSKKTTVNYERKEPQSARSWRKVSEQSKKLNIDRITPTDKKIGSGVSDSQKTRRGSNQKKKK